MMILFKKCTVYAPELLGPMDVLVGEGKILAIENEIECPANFPCETVQGDGLKMIPGLIDSHVHIAGAGGEGGPATRTPELKLSQMLEGGITTVIGCLGTDGFTRSVESVLMKAKSLRGEGVSAWIYTGSYQVPTPTILGDVGKDIALIDEVIGVGEIALADHRSSCPTAEELLRIAEHARVGGLLGGKAGIVNFHMGDARSTFSVIYQVIQKSQLKKTQFLPTHCNRNNYLLEDAKTYGKKGYVDITTSSYHFNPNKEIKASKAIVSLIEAEVPLQNITMTSDGCGSIPEFDAEGFLIQLHIAEPKTIFNELLDLVNEENWPLENALKLVTSNVADILKLHHKGRISVGKDADLVLLNNDNEIYYMIANGNIMIKEGTQVKFGLFENPKHP